jgi:methionyl-tRNA formyltransferase
MTAAPPLRVVFMGTPDFAVGSLRALHRAGHHIVAAYCQPPKPAGRGHHIQKTPVHLAAEELGIEVRTPKSLRDIAEQEKFAQMNADVAVVAAYGLLLPKAVLDSPKYGCLNIHGSLLPRWRGAAPLHRAILAGDKETGITIMQMDEGLDTGVMLLKEAVAVTNKTTAQSLHDQLADIGASLIVRALDDLSEGKLPPTPQSEEGVTYAKKLTREEGKIDWNVPASDIERKIRALNPWPGCFFMLNDEPVKVLAASIVEGKSGGPGVLLDDSFTVACGEKALKLDLVQRAGKKPTDGASLLRGLRLPVGSRVGA